MEIEQEDMNFKTMSKLNTIFKQKKEGKRTGFLPGVNTSPTDEKKKGMKLKNIIN